MFTSFSFRINQQSRFRTYLAVMYGIHGVSSSEWLPIIHSHLGSTSVDGSKVRSSSKARGSNFRQIFLLRTSTPKPKYCKRISYYIDSTFARITSPTPSEARRYTSSPLPHPRSAKFWRLHPVTSCSCSHKVWKRTDHNRLYAINTQNIGFLVCRNPYEVSMRSTEGYYCALLTGRPWKISWKSSKSLSKKFHGEPSEKKIEKLQHRPNSSTIYLAKNTSRLRGLFGYTCRPSKKPKSVTKKLNTSTLRKRLFESTYCGN